MSYQVAEEMIAKGKVMLNKTFVGKSINDFDISKIGNTYYRYSMFTGYVSWKNEVHARVAGDLKAHVFTALIDSIGEAYRRAQENQVIEQTTQVAEVVVDELAIAIARIAELEASVKSLDLKAANQAQTIKSQERVIQHLTNDVKSKTRTIVINGSLTKVAVLNKVGF